MDSGSQQKITKYMFKNIIARAKEIGAYIRREPDPEVSTCTSCILGVSNSCLISAQSACADVMPFGRFMGTDVHKEQIIEYTESLKSLEALHG